MIHDPTLAPGARVASTDKLLTEISNETSNAIGQLDYVETFSRAIMSLLSTVQTLVGDGPDGMLKTYVRAELQHIENLLDLQSRKLEETKAALETVIKATGD